VERQLSTDNSVGKGQLALGNWQFAKKNKIINKISKNTIGVFANYFSQIAN
jgi:hypothetical protein